MKLGPNLAVWALAFFFPTMGVVVTASGAEARPLRPGAYGGLLLGYDPSTQVVSGYFQTGTGLSDWDNPDSGPQFTCIFYLKGKYQGDQATIETFDPATPRDDLISGTLTVGKDGSVKISLPEDHGGCGMAWSFTKDSALTTFSLDTARPWTQIRVVRSKRAYFYDAPDSPVHRKAHLVHDDGVGVVGSARGWLRVEFPSSDGKTVQPQRIEWMREADFYPGS